jgi:hypothetical protein
MSNPTTMPLDRNNNPIPALRLSGDKAHTLTAGAVSSKNITAFDADTRVVMVTPLIDVTVRFGGASVVAASTDHYLLGGIPYQFAVEPAFTPYLAVLRVGATDGAVKISEMN